MKTRLISALLLICMLVTVIPTAQAVVDESIEESIVEAQPCLAFENAYEPLPEPIELPYGPPEEDRTYLAPTDDWTYEAGILASVEKDVVAAIRAGQSTVDVSGYRIYKEQMKLYKLR